MYAVLFTAVELLDGRADAQTNQNKCSYFGSGFAIQCKAFQTLKWHPMVNIIPYTNEKPLTTSLG